MNATMKNRFFTLLTSFLLIMFVLNTHVRAQTASFENLHFEILLSSRMLSDINLNVTFINSFAFTENQNILLSTSEQFYLLGAGGIIPFGKKNVGEIFDFALTHDNLLMVVRNNKICTFDSTGVLKQLYLIPVDGMGISPGKYVMYVYNKRMNAKGFSLYAIAEKGKYKHLFEVPKPILSVYEHGNTVLFSTGNGIFSYDIPTKKIKGVVSVQENKIIQSFALDTLKNILYFSTENEILALYKNTVITISREFGGNLKYYKQGLVIFNHRQKYIIRVSGMENAITNAEVKKPEKPKETTKETLTNTSIINLVNAGIKDDLIVNLINSSPVDFDVSVDGIIYLSNQKVSSVVISAMVDAMKNK